MPYVVVSFLGAKLTLDAYMHVNQLIGCSDTLCRDASLSSYLLGFLSNTFAGVRVT